MYACVYSLGKMSKTRSEVRICAHFMLLELTMPAWYLIFPKKFANKCQVSYYWVTQTIIYFHMQNIESENNYTTDRAHKEQLACKVSGGHFTAHLEVGWNVKTQSYQPDLWYAIFSCSCTVGRRCRENGAIQDELIWYLGFNMETFTVQK